MEEDRRQQEAVRVLELLPTVPLDHRHLNEDGGTTATTMQDAAGATDRNLNGLMKQ